MKKFFKKLKSLNKEVNLPVVNENNKKMPKFLVKKRKVRLPKYFIDSWKEIKKVTWPSRKESLKLTLAVAIFTLVFTIVTVIADYLFSEIVERIIL